VSASRSPLDFHAAPGVTFGATVASVAIACSRYRTSVNDHSTPLEFVIATCPPPPVSSVPS
jgi:hypothetical protein